MTNYKNYLKKRLENDSDFKELWDANRVKRDLAKDIIRFRIQNNLTQSQLAELAGTTQNIISKLERGTYNPSVNFLEKLSIALNSKLELHLV